MNYRNNSEQSIEAIDIIHTRAARIKFTGRLLRKHIALT